MAEVLSSTLAIEVHIRTILIVVAALELIPAGSATPVRIVRSTARLKDVEDIEAVVLVELEGVGHFVRARVVFVAGRLLIITTFFGRGVFEVLVVERLVLQYLLIQRLFGEELSGGAPLTTTVKSIHTWHEVLDALIIRELLNQWILALR